MLLWKYLDDFSTIASEILTVIGVVTSCGAIVGAASSPPTKMASELPASLMEKSLPRGTFTMVGSSLSVSICT